MTERWTDKMLDDLAEVVEQTNHNIDMLVGAVNSLVEHDRESIEENRRRDEEIQRNNQEFQRYKLENDQRFNTLLEEVRFLIRQLGNQ